MAFALFKKTKKADIILYNGTVLTLDPMMPQAEAVACSDGEVIAVGDMEAMEELSGDDTRIIDLDGKYVTPGLIDFRFNSIMKIFDGQFLNLSGCSQLEDISRKVAQWAEAHPDDEMIFGYGYSEKALEEEELSPETIVGLLDEGCADKPVVLLCESSVSCILNSCASDIVKETAEEEMVQYITTPYILNLFVPFDFEETEERAAAEITRQLSAGITAQLETSAPDYFETLYQDALIGLYNEENLYQRFFGSYMMNRPLFPKGLVHRLMGRKTMCNEIDGLINADMLHVDLDTARCPVEFSTDSLLTILGEVADKGFPIYITAQSPDDLDMAVAGLEYIRNKGYKNTFVIDSPHRVNDADFVHSESARYIPSREEMFSMDMDSFLETVTVTAAQIIGAADSLGSIEKGKRADMAVFDKNPLSMTAAEFWSYPACMTIFNGKVV